jgi:taurine dehydrogenase small subunit
VDDHLRCGDRDARRSDVEREILERLLAEHTDAWNCHDLDRLMSLFADDCVFEASAGPDFNGRRFEGRADVRSAFAAVLDSMPDATWGDGRHFVLAGDYGVSEWRLTGTRVDGSRVDVLGCDFLTVRGHEIVRKSSFRKHRLPVTE